MTVSTHKHYIHDAHRKIPINRFSLWNVTDTRNSLFVWLAKDLHPSAIRLHDTHDSLYQGGLARPVRPHHADQRTSLNDSVHPVKDGLAIIGNREVVNLQGRGNMSHTITSTLPRWRSRYASSCRPKCLYRIARHPVPVPSDPVGPWHQKTIRRRSSPRLPWRYL